MIYQIKYSCGTRAAKTEVYGLEDLGPIEIHELDTLRENPTSVRFILRKP